jgi:two-component system, NarL family, nitrate/nitrite response regulator NarL
MSISSVGIIGILLVDDHAVVRAGLKMLIEGEPEMRIIGEASCRAEALSAAAAQPDVILLDLDLGEENGLDFLPDLLQLAPAARIIVLTGVTDSEIHQQAVMLGAMGLVLKAEVTRVLLTAIRKVFAGEAWLNRSMVAKVISEISHHGKVSQLDSEAARIASLTEREGQVIALVGEGLRNRQIGDRLFISEKTVRHYLTSIFDKLEVTDRLELIIYAYQHGLANLPQLPPANRTRPPH